MRRLRRAIWKALFASSSDRIRTPPPAYVSLVLNLCERIEHPLLRDAPRLDSSPLPSLRSRRRGNVLCRLWVLLRPSRFDPRFPIVNQKSKMDLLPLSLLNDVLYCPRRAATSFAQFRLQVAGASLLGRGIPTGFSPKAQGCEARATLGMRPQMETNRNAVVTKTIRSTSRQICRNRVAVVPVLPRSPKVGAAAPTLGFGPQPRRGWRKRQRYDTTSVCRN